MLIRTVFLINKSMAFGMLRFGAAFTSAFQRFLSRAETIQLLTFSPILIKIHYNLSRGLLPIGLPDNILKSLQPFPILR